MWVTACGAKRIVTGRCDQAICSDTGFDKGLVFDWHGCSALALAEAKYEADSVSVPSKKLLQHSSLFTSWYGTEVLACKDPNLSHCISAYRQKKYQRFIRKLGRCSQRGCIVHLEQ